MNKQLTKLKEEWEGVKAVIQSITEDLDSITSDMEDLEDNECVSEVQFKIPAHIYREYEDYEKIISSVFGRMEKIEPFDDTDQIDELRNALDKFKASYDDWEGDDVTFVYDLMSDIDTPLGALDEMWEEIE